VQPDRKLWWRNLRQPARVRLHLQGRDVEGTATATSDSVAVAAGLGRYLERYPKAAKPLGSAWTPVARPTAPTQPPTRWSWSLCTLIVPSQPPLIRLAGRASVRPR
jgi:hypothetical protein